MKHCSGDQSSIKSHSSSGRNGEPIRVTQTRLSVYANARLWHPTTSRAAPDQLATCGKTQPVTRRDALLAVAGSSLSAGCLSSAAAVANAQRQGITGSSVSAPDGVTAEDLHLAGHALPDYTGDGPLAVVPFPELEHTCSRCFPACLGNRCMLRLEVVFPKNGKAHGAQPGVQGMSRKA